MKHWNLRTRLTLWTAAFFAAAVGLLGLATVSLVRKHQIESLDAELQADTRSVLHELDEHGAAGMKHVGEKVDPAARYRVTAPDGSVIFASPELAGESLAGSAGIQTIGRWRVCSGSVDGFTVRLARGFEQVDATVADVGRAFLLALPALLLLVGGGAWWLVRTALAPVRDIGAAARRITTERLDQRLPVPERMDEVGQLTSVLNDMLDRLDRGHRQAMRFTADASHELKTPLALMAVGMEELLRRRDLPPDVMASVGGLLDDNRRLAAICQDLLVLARADAGQLALDRQRHDLGLLLEAAVEDARILAAPSRLNFEVVRPPETCPELVDARYLTRILLNVLSNAVKYNRVDGLVRVELAGGPNAWTVDIANTGEGLSAEVAPHLFERFYRVRKAAAGGHGLGLSLSRELARAHGGDLTLQPAQAGWTCFRLRLPRQLAQSVAPS